MGLGNKRGSSGKSAAAGFLAGGLMTGWSSAKRCWVELTAPGICLEGGSSSGGLQAARVGALCWSCCWIHQRHGTHWHLLSSGVCAGCRTLQALPGCTGFFYGQAMRYGWDCEDYQVCAGEVDFHAGKASGPSAWLARWVALHHPQESRWLPWAATSAKCHQGPWVPRAGSQEGGGGRAPQGSCLPKPGAADFNLFPPLNEAQNLHMMFFPHLKLSVKLRFQHKRNNLAALYRHIWEVLPQPGTFLHSGFVFCYCKHLSWDWVAGEFFPSDQVNSGCVCNAASRCWSLALAGRRPFRILSSLKEIIPLWKHPLTTRPLPWKPPWQMRQGWFAGPCLQSQKVQGLEISQVWVWDWASALPSATQG